MRRSAKAEGKNLLSEIDIRSMHSKTSKQGMATIDVSFLVKNRDELADISTKIRQIDSVVDIERA